MLRLVDSNPTGENDAEYVARARQGNRAQRKIAFTELVIRHELYVRNLLRHLCRDEAVAQDLAQDTFVIAWQKLSALKNPEGFGAWVRRIAYREFLHMLRRGKLESDYIESVQVEDEDYADDLNEDTELARWLEVCSPIEREILLLRFAYGFTQEEIAADRKLPVGTVKSHVHRAKAKIKTLLEADAAREGLEMKHHG